jgi:uncharacterized phage protein (TIGR01671 family)
VKINKFRGKSIDRIKNGQWVFGTPVYTKDYQGNQRVFIVPIDAELVLIYSSRHIHWDSLSEVEPESVGQFTGLTDEAGAEIYDGDLITSDLIHLFNDSDIVKNPCVVEWRSDGWYKGGFTVRLGNRETSLQKALEGWTSKVFKVVGNIHESLTPSPVTER